MTADDPRKAEAARKAASRVAERLRVAEKLRNLTEAHAAYALAAETARTKRNKAILQALEEGWTHAAISQATGLSRGRISQIKP